MNDGTATTTYSYDSQNQLTLSMTGNDSSGYTYDTYGNIRTKTHSYGGGLASENYTFTYGNSQWKDQLTQVSYTSTSGVTTTDTLSYDAIGNPTKYFNGKKVWEFDWQHERQLQKAEYKVNGAVQTFVNETTTLVHVHVNGEEIVATPEHPFYSPVKGWTSAVDLRAGDILILRSDKYVIVELVQHEMLEAPVKVYNFEVADYHTYYVGDSAILVHNRCNGNWTNAKYGARANEQYHYDKHGYELGVNSMEEYTKKLRILRILFWTKE